MNDIAPAVRVDSRLKKVFYLATFSVFLISCLCFLHVAYANLNHDSLENTGFDYLASAQNVSKIIAAPNTIGKTSDTGEMELLPLDGLDLERQRIADEIRSG